MGDSPISPHDFGASFKTFMEQMARQSPAEEPFFLRRLREHFDGDPSKFSIVAEKFADTNHANVHLAIESFATGAGRSHELLGISGDANPYMGMSFAQLICAPGGRIAAPAEGPVTYRNVALDGDRVLACTQLGLYLVGEGGTRLAILVARTERGFNDGIKVEVLARERSTADGCLAGIRTAMRKRNVYRGHVVSLALNEMHQLQTTFHRLPQIAREQIILPSGVLDGSSVKASASRSTPRSCAPPGVT